MRKLFAILVPMVIGILLTATVYAQTPEKMSYQSVIRDADDNLVTNQSIGMQISILQGSSTGTAVYTETQTPTTNTNGLVSIEIGGGADFSTIDWANDIYFIKTETDPDGGTNYSITGTSQLLSVPYALHANEVDPSVPQGTQTGEMQYWNGTEWVIVPTGTEGSTLQLIGGVPAWTGGSGPTVPGAPTIGTATAGDAQASVSFTAPASNGGSPILSYTATSEPGNFTATLEGSGITTITVTGLTNGTAYTFTVTATNAIGTSAASAASNSVTPAGSSVPNVTNPTTGEIWMDRNLGASQVATSSTDEDAYGDLYQWGRAAEGHQVRTSATSSTLATTAEPDQGNDWDGKFICTWDTLPCDWLTPQNDNLWQGVNGTNNPCPAGYRLPTETELEAERASWTSNNAAGAYASPLKLTNAGLRSYWDGVLYNEGGAGTYWSSTVDGDYSYYLNFMTNNAYMFTYYRADGNSVRCIKD